MALPAEDVAAAAFAVGARAAQAGLTIKECLQVARAVVSRAGALAQAEVEQGFQALKRYRSGDGAIAVEQLHTDLPDLKSFDLVPKANASCPVFSVAPPSNDSICDALAYAHTEVFATNLSSKLGDTWQDAHKTIVHDQCPKVSAEVPAVTKCRDAGICLCSDAGKDIAALCNAVMARQKKK